MKKNEFFSMSDSDAIEYITDMYYIDDINNACEDYVLEVCEYDEDEYEEMMEDNQPFEIVRENMEGDELKEFLWDNIIEECEELDFEEEDEGGEY